MWANYLVHLHLPLFPPFFLPGEQGGAEVERTRLPPMWSKFKSRRRCHLSGEFVVSSLLCSERFFFRVLGFPLSSKTNIPSSSSTRNQVDEEPLSGCATSKSKSLFIYSFTYSFIYLFISRIIKISCMNCYDVRFWRPSLYQFKQIDKKYLRFQVRFENSPFS